MLISSNELIYTDAVHVSDNKSFSQRHTLELVWRDLTCEIAQDTSNWTEVHRAPLFVSKFLTRFERYEVAAWSWPLALAHFANSLSPRVAATRLQPRGFTAVLCLKTIPANVCNLTSCPKSLRQLNSFTLSSVNTPGGQTFAVRALARCAYTNACLTNCVVFARGLRNRESRLWWSR